MLSFHIPILDRLKGWKVIPFLKGASFFADEKPSHFCYTSLIFRWIYGKSSRFFVFAKLLVFCFQGPSMNHVMTMCIIDRVMYHKYALLTDHSELTETFSFFTFIKMTHWTNPFIEKWYTYHTLYLGSKFFVQKFP